MRTPTIESRNLREPESMFRLLFESAAVGIVVLDGDGRCLEVNPRFHQMLRESPDRLLGGTLEGTVHPEDWFAHRRLVNEVARRHRREASMEARYRCGGRQQWKWVRVRFTALDVGDVRLMAVIEDIDALKKSQQIMFENGRMFREMLDALPAAIYTTDADGNVTHYNRAAAVFSGLEPELGQKWCVTWRLHYPDGRPMRHSECPMAVALREGREVFGEEAIAVRPDGTRAWFTPYPVPLRNRFGDIVGGINMLVDITERKRIEEDLRRHRDNLQDLVRERTREVLEANARVRHAERMVVVGTLSAGLGHDMANLLVPVHIRIDALSRMDLPEGARDHLAAIKTSAAQLQKLSGGLRLLAADPGMGRKGPTEVGAWWDDSGRILRTVLPGSVSLESDLPAAPVWVRMAKTALLQAVFNLVQNAADALGNRTDGRVLVKAEASDDHVVITVTDNGPGMSDEVRRRCFEPFFTTKHRAISTGLGLSIVYGLVQEAGGDIDLKSQADDGTTFTIRLWRSAPPEELEARRPRRAARVQVADARMRAIVALELRGLGYDVVTESAPGVPAELIVSDHVPQHPLEGKLVLLSDDPDRPASATALGAKPPVQAIRKALGDITATAAKAGAS